MKRPLLPVLLSLLLCSALAHGAPFYEGKSLAHPAITASQDSGFDIAFFKEKEGINGYYCECKSSNSKPILLDQFGNDGMLLLTIFLTLVFLPALYALWFKIKPPVSVERLDAAPVDKGHAVRDLEHRRHVVGDDEARAMEPIAQRTTSAQRLGSGQGGPRQRRFTVL